MKAYLFRTCILLLFFIVGCKSATDKVKDDFMPVARGEDDEIILVIDSAIWEGQVGDQLKGMYEEYLRGLPQDEPKFSVRKVNPRKLNSVLKNAKNLIFVMTLDSRTTQSRAVREYFTDNSLKMIQNDSSLFYTAKRNEFAKGQIVLYLFGQNEVKLLENVKNSEDRLVALFESAVRERTAEKILAKTESQLIKAITEDHEYQISVPFGWDLAKNLEDFVWVRNLESNSESNVFIYETAYTNRDLFNDIGLFRDRITSTYLRDSEKPKLYIARQEIVPVFTKRVTFNEKFALEARGLWRVSDNTAGGPFVSYTIVDEELQKLYYIEGYVYSPGTKKKHLVREVEAILSTFRTPSEVNADPS